MKYRASQMKARNHIPKARQDWNCKGCGKTIDRGSPYFFSLHYTSYQFARHGHSGTYRKHLTCVTETDVCCLVARQQLSAHRLL